MDQPILAQNGINSWPKNKDINSKLVHNVGRTIGFEVFRIFPDILSEILVQFGPKFWLIKSTEILVKKLVHII